MGTTLYPALAAQDMLMSTAVVLVLGLLASTDPRLASVPLQPHTRPWQQDLTRIFAMSAIVLQKSAARPSHQGDQIIKGLDAVSPSTCRLKESSSVSPGPSGSGKTTLLNAMGGLDTSGQR